MLSFKHTQFLPPGHSASSPPGCGRPCWFHWKSPLHSCLSWEVGPPARQHVWRTAHNPSGDKRCWPRCFLPDFKSAVWRTGSTTAQRIFGLILHRLNVVRLNMSAFVKCKRVLWPFLKPSRRDSHQRREVWEGGGFEQQRESSLHTLPVVGRQSQREGGRYPLVLTDKDREEKISHW